MRRFEKQFLDEVKKPLKKIDSFTVTVKRYFTDATGNVVAKAGLAANLKTSIPFYLWQKFDKDGGFKISQQILPPQTPWTYLYCYEVGSSFDYFQFSGFNTVNQNFKPGDLVLVYGDDKVNINFLAWIVINCPFQAYTAMLHYNNGGDFMTGDNAGIEVYELLYNADQIQQYNEALHLLTTNRIGQFSDEQTQPLSFKTPETVLSDFITLKVNFEINYMFGILSNFQFNSELLIFNHKIKI